MRSRALLPIILVMAVFTLTDAQADAPVFPGANGFGIHQNPGRGTIYVVDDLEDSGSEGTLRYALEQSEKRTIIFAVGGYIDLQEVLEINSGDVAIMGQTAPFPGITLRGQGLAINAPNVLIQHLKIRPGVRRPPQDPDTDRPLGHGDFRCILLTENAHDVVIDHCSLTWAVDETIGFNTSISSTLEDVTISNCIIAEALNRSAHIKGAHSDGILISQDNKKIAVLRNLLANNVNRNPKVTSGAELVFVNNITYGTTETIGLVKKDPTKPVFASIEGNIFDPTPDGLLARIVAFVPQDISPDSRVYASNNNCLYCLVQDDCWLGPSGLANRNGIRLQDSLATPDVCVDNPANRPIWPPAGDIVVLPLDSLENYISDYVGAFPGERDSIDQRILDQDFDDDDLSTEPVMDCVDGSDKLLIRGQVDAATDTTIEIDACSIEWSSFAEFFDDISSCCVMSAGGAYDDGIYYLKSESGEERLITKFKTSCGGYTVCYQCSTSTPGCTGNDTTHCTFNRFTVEPWNNTPTPGEDIEVILKCSAANANVAGGWPSFTPQERTIYPPDASYANEEMVSGYTILEEWLHKFPKQNNNVDSLAFTNSVVYNDSGAPPDTAMYFNYQYRFFVSWNTDQPATSELLIREQGSLWKHVTADTTDSLNHYVVVSSSLYPPGIDAGKTYEVIPVSTRTGWTQYGPRLSVTMPDADATLTSFDLTQDVLGQRHSKYLSLTFDFTTDQNTYAKINLRTHEDTLSSWEGDELLEVFSSTATASHSHVITDLMTGGGPTPLEFETQYDFYIRISPNASMGSEDTYFPDGFSGYDETLVFGTFVTPDQTGSGGSDPDPFELTTLFDDDSSPPSHSTYLGYNFPNPFNPTTTISYGVKESGSRVRLEVIDVTGRIIRVLEEGVKEAGQYTVVWNGTNESGQPVATGLYFLRLQVDQKEFMKKMILLK